MELSTLTEAISAGFGVVHGGEGLDEAHDGAEEGGDIGEKSDVGGAFSSWGMISIMHSSMAISVSSRRRTAPWRASPMLSIWAMVDLSSLVISRAWSKSPSARSGCTWPHILRFLDRMRFS